MRYAACVVLGALMLACSKDNDPVAIKDEGIYINEVYASSGEDWIELYNAGEGSKDLGGYKIYDNGDAKYTLPGGTTIDAGGFIVLVCDDTGTGLHTSFKLSSEGETLTLENAAGEAIDQVAFPAMNDGESYGRFPDGSNNLRVSGSSTRGTSNGEAGAALIASVTRQPLIVLPNTQVTISADVKANGANAVSSVNLFYRNNGGTFTTVAMTLAAGTIYSATIPAFENAFIEYYVQAVTDEDVKTLSPFDAPEGLYEYSVSTALLPDLFINEVMAINTSCCPDTDGGTEEFDDWIEIYNAGSESIDIGGMFLSDDPANPFKNKIPDDNASATTIPAGGFIVLWADENGSQGDLHLNFQLSATGETVGLYFVDGRTVDERTFGSQTENVSQGLTHDGGSTWAALANPSPGATND